MEINITNLDPAFCECSNTSSLPREVALANLHGMHLIKKLSLDL